METNLRKLLVEERLPLDPEPGCEPGRVSRTIDVVVIDTQLDQEILAISEESEHIISVLGVKRFFPPLVEYQGTIEQIELAIQERILALFEAAARRTCKLKGWPEVGKDQLEPFLQDRLGGEGPLHLITSVEGLGQPERTFRVANLPDGLVIGVRGQPGVCLATPRGVGLFVNDLKAVVGTRVV